MDELQTEKPRSEPKNSEFGKTIVQFYPNLRIFCFSPKKQPMGETVIT